MRPSSTRRTVHALLIAGALAVCCALLAQAARPAEAATVWGPGLKVTPPASALSGYANSTMRAVSCPSAGACTAAGTYADRFGHLQGLLVTRTGGVWARAVPAALPAATAANPDVKLVSVSCASAGNCAAVGTYVDDHGKRQGLLLTETSRTWAAGTKATLPAGAAATPAVDLRSVSCPSAGTCVAVGTYADTSSDTRGLVLTATSGAWAPGSTATLPTDASNSNPDVVLTSVSCPSPGNCAAVGSYGAVGRVFVDSLTTAPLLISQSSGAWTAPIVHLPGGADAAGDMNASLRSVSCASAGNCAAVGSFRDPRTSVTAGLLIDEVSGAWQDGVAPALPAGAAGNPAVDLASVSCPAAGACTAVGSYSSSTGRQGLLVSGGAGAWAGGTTAPLPAGTAVDPAVALRAVSCASAGNCTAVGAYADGSGRTQGVLLTRSAGSWGSASVAALPTDASGSTPDVDLGAVSCASAGDCSAAGGYGATSRASLALLLDQTSGVWAEGTSPPPPADAAKVGQVSLRSVSCVSAGECTAVGSFTDLLGGQPMTVRKSSGVWGTGVQPEMPAGAAANPFVLLGSVACASAGDCAAVGSYLDTSHRGQGVILSETAGAWATGIKATLPAGAAADPHVVLQSVSCGAPGDCAAAGTYLDTSGATQGLLVSRTAGVWGTGIKADLPPGAAADPKVALTSVSCASAGSCVAVGSFTDDAGKAHALLLSRSGGVWVPGTVPALPAGASPDQLAQLTSVSCPAAGACTAVGMYLDPVAGLRGFSVSQLSGVWGMAIAASRPAGAPALENVFLGSAGCYSLGNCRAVSCPEPGACAAVGNFNDGAVEHPFLVSGTAGALTAATEATLPTGGSLTSGTGPATVSCGSPGNCASVGSFRDGANRMQGVLLSQSAGTWAPGITATLPTAAGSDPLVQLPSVSCVAGGACTAVGSYVDDASQGIGLVIERKFEADPAPSDPGGGGGGTTSLPAPPSAPPAGPAAVAPGSVTVGQATVSGTTASLPVTCAGTAACTVTLTLSVVEKLRNGRVVGVSAAKRKAKTIKKTVVVGRTTVTIPPRTTRVVRLSLNKAGKRLLAKRSPLKVRLTVTVAGKTMSSTKVTFKRPATKRRPAR